MLAGVVTLAVFSAALWVSEAVLPLWIKSDSDRWAVATSLSVALAAVAALWGAAFAQRADKPDPAEDQPQTVAPHADKPDPADDQPETVAQPADPPGTSITMHGEASGHGRVYQAGHDQIINEK
jgi:hypothetical protein